MIRLRSHIKCQSKNYHAGMPNPVTALTFRRSHALTRQKKKISLKKKNSTSEFKPIFLIILKFLAWLTNAQ